MTMRDMAGLVLKELREAQDWISGPEIARRNGLIPGDTWSPLMRMYKAGQVERIKVGKAWHWRLVHDPAQMAQKSQSR